MDLNQYGVYGDGVHDDSVGLQAVLDSGEKDIYIPQGCYLIKTPLKIHSNTNLTANPNARFILDGSVQRHRGDFLLSNADVDGGNENISIRGGVWDGNNQGAGNQKPDLFDKNGYSGAVLNFVNVKGLRLENLVVANSVTYFVRMSGLEDFEINDISFVSDCYGKNQDGLHFGGRVKNGRVKNIRALSTGQTNDDLIALNADDSIERVENLDLYRDYIENVTFENLFAENCHTIIRILSIDAPIRNVRIRNVYGGFRCYAINGDAARYCRTPLFAEEENPLGVGKIENISIENMTVYNTDPQNTRPAVCMESCAEGLYLRNFKVVERNGVPRPEVALYARNVVNQLYTVDGKECPVKDKTEELRVHDFTDLEIRRG